MARPEISLDWTKIDSFLEAGAKGAEIAAHFHVSPDTIYRQVKSKFDMSFADYAFEKCQKGESLLKYKQFSVAMKGNVSMLIWLGKVRLGQREPDALSLSPPMELDITKDHKLMEKEHKIIELQNKLATLEANANKPQTE